MCYFNIIFDYFEIIYLFIRIISLSIYANISSNIYEMNVFELISLESVIEEINPLK